MFKVYCTTLSDGRFYIGFSGKTGEDYEKYFGSNALVKSHKDKTKETIAMYSKKSHAKAIEHLLQWNNRNNHLMINKMWNVRLRLDHLRGLTIPDWEPKNLLNDPDATLMGDIDD